MVKVNANNHQPTINKIQLERRRPFSNIITGVGEITGVDVSAEQIKLALQAEKEQDHPSSPLPSYVVEDVCTANSTLKGITLVLLMILLLAYRRV